MALKILFKHAEKHIKGKFQEQVNVDLTVVNATTTSTFVSNLAFISHSRVFFASGAWLKKSRKKKSGSHAKMKNKKSRENTILYIARNFARPFMSVAFYPRDICCIWGTT